MSADFDPDGRLPRQERRSLGARYLRAYVADDTELMADLRAAATDTELLDGVAATAKLIARTLARIERIDVDNLLSDVHLAALMALLSIQGDPTDSP